METKHKTLADLIKLAQKAIEFIDALPKDLVLPSMPGFNRDWADDVIHEAAEIYASEENRKKDEPQQSDVEQDARIFCEHLDEELGEAWSNDYDELPKRMAEFALKWQSQQLVSIQWLSGEEIENISIKTYFKHERMSSDTRAIIQAERGAFVNGFNQAQSSLRNRVNAVDPVEFAEWIRTEKFTPMTMNNGQYWDQHNQLHRLYGYRKTTQELLQIYINSKTKEHE